MKQRVLLRGAVAAALAVLLSGCGGYNWLQWGGGPAHSGQNLGERSITPANVSTLHRLFVASLPVGADGAPAYLSNVSTPSGAHDALFAESELGDLVAFDAHSGARALEGHVLGEHVPHQQHAGAVLHDVVAGDRSQRAVRLRVRARRQGAQGRDRHRHGSDRRALARAQHAEGFRREGIFGALDRDRAQRHVVSLLDALRLSR